MKLAFIGTGYVGLVTAAVMADLGNEAWGLDIDQKRIAGLVKGQMPFFEPGLADLVRKGLKKGRLHFTLSYPEAISPAEIVFICVGTPAQANGETDLKAVLNAARSLAPHLKKGAIVVIKSTIPPPAHLIVEEQIKALAKTKFSLASCPEFLREGQAVKDTFHPERVIIGAGDKAAIAKLLKLHQPLGGQRLVCSPPSAQLIKYAANVFLAMKISFANLIAEVAEKYQAEINEVLAGVGADPRIGSLFLRPGLGYGGSCLPKDLDAFDHLTDPKATGGLLKAIKAINERQLKRCLGKAESLLGSISGQTVAILGLAFKPGTDDCRQAPAIKLIKQFLKSGAKVRAYDPQVGSKLKKQLAEVIYCNGSDQAFEGADLLVLVTEWEEFKDLNWSRVKKLMRKPNIIDGRNLWSSLELIKKGFRYEGFGN